MPQSEGLCQELMGAAVRRLERRWEVRHAD